MNQGKSFSIIIAIFDYLIYISLKVVFGGKCRVECFEEIKIYICICNTIFIIRLIACMQWCTHGQIVDINHNYFPSLLRMPNRHKDT